MEQVAEEAVNPMMLKKRLAREIVGQFHGTEAAKVAEANFEKEVQSGEAPEKMEQYTGIAFDLGGGIYRLDITKALLEKGLVKSRGEVKRLIAQGAIEINGEKINNTTVDIPSGSVIQVGKRRFLKISIKKIDA